LHWSSIDDFSGGIGHRTKGYLNAGRGARLEATTAIFTLLKYIQTKAIYLYVHWFCIPNNILNKILVTQVG